MQIISHAQANKFTASPTTSIWEYFTKDEALSGAVAQIDGRYPEKGFALNEKSKELAFVIAGSGSIVHPTDEEPIGVGDVIMLDANEKFAWHGKITLFMVTVPKFEAKQHKIVSK